MKQIDDAECPYRPTTSSPDFDAVIVGASLAGCTAATLLGRAGLRVALVEKQPDPRAFKRVCTHFIQPSALPTLERLGLLDPIMAAGAVRSRVSYWTRWGWIEAPPERVEPRVNLRREALDPIVRGAAGETPGVELMLGCTAQRLLEEGGAVRGVVVREPSGRETELRGRVTIGADGRDSGVAELAGLTGRTLRHGRFFYSGYFEGPPPVPGTHDALSWLMDPQWASALPTDGGLVHYMAMPTRDRLPEFKRDPAKALVSFIADVPDPPPILESRLAGPVVGKLEMPNRVRGPIAPGLALIGDAALASDPLPGIGCGWAFQSGEWLADSVAPTLRGEESLRRGLVRYRRLHRRELRGHAALIHYYSTGRRFDLVTRLVFATATRDADAALALDRVVMRSAKPGRAFARSLPHGLIANARRRVWPRPAGTGREGAGGWGRQVSAVVERRRLAVDGAEPRLLEAGPREADEAVVFVHGNPGSADDWEALIGAVADTGLRALALDLPDFGETEAPEGFEHSVPGYAAFLGQALEALGVERAHLVLHDFGGPIGLKWASTHTDAVASVTLIDIGLLPGYRWHRAARIWRIPLLGELFQATTTRRGFRWGVNRNEPRGLPRPFLDEMYDHYDRRTRRAVLRLYRATDHLGASAAEFAENVGPSDIPALVIWGEDDAYLPAKFAAAQREVFPAADVHVLPASGHWPYKDAPETVERLLVDFLGSAAGMKQR